MKTVLFINTARLFDIVIEANIQVRMSKRRIINLFPLILAFRILCKTEICDEVSTMSGWGVSIIFDTLYLSIENMVSGHIRGYCIF